MKRLSVRGCDGVADRCFTFDWNNDTRPLAKRSMMRHMIVRACR